MDQWLNTINNETINYTINVQLSAWFTYSYLGAFDGFVDC